MLVHIFFSLNVSHSPKIKTLARYARFPQLTPLCREGNFHWSPVNLGMGKRKELELIQAIYRTHYIPFLRHSWGYCPKVCNNGRRTEEPVWNKLKMKIENPLTNKFEISEARHNYCTREHHCDGHNFPIKKELQIARCLSTNTIYPNRTTKVQIEVQWRDLTSI